MPPTKYELRDIFVDDIHRIYNLYNSLSKHATTLECSVLAEQTIVSKTVALESFISEILVTLISEDPNRFLSNQIQEMKDHLINKAGYSHMEVQYLAHEGVKRIKNEDLREFILDDGDNLAFPETSKLKEFIAKNLPRALGFEVTPEDAMLIDILKGTRNLCAHHSQKAAKTLSGIHKKHFHDHKLNSLAVCRTLIQENDITVRNLGEYLRMEIPPNKNRIEYISSYLRDMAFRWIK